MRKDSISVRLSFKYMSVVAFMTMSVCCIFSALLFIYAKTIRTADLKENTSLIRRTMLTSGTEELYFLELPYFISYKVYEKNTENVLATNDRLLPVLNIRPNKMTEYFEKDFYSDSNLKIAAYSEEVLLDNKVIVVECAMDIENDSLSKMQKGLIKIILACIIPILCISFFISYLISRKTISAFRKLESAFEKEKSFTSNVSHELKTPLAIIDGHANLIHRWGKEKPEQVESSVKVILEETQNMERIIQTLLELSKIEKGMIQVQDSEFFVSNLFVKIRDEFRSLHENVDFIIKDDDYVQIRSDEKILHQILTVIVSNSIKFAGEACTITLSCRQCEDRIHLEIMDDGPGFKEETIPFIFERFYKGDKSHTRNGGGAGLGLAIAKALVQELSGEISARNNENGGASIDLWLSQKSE